jgi:hypothetical protein
LGWRNDVLPEDDRVGKTELRRKKSQLFVFFPDTTGLTVMSQFLDAQRIHNLVTYLQELHALGLANADHTTLLLNTYTKLKDVARLDSFIKTESRRSGATESNGDLPFDLDTAIRVCRQAGYFDHASYLAKRYQRHEEYLRVMIEDAGKYGEALTYLRHLGAAAVRPIFVFFCLHFFQV